MEKGALQKIQNHVYTSFKVIPIWLGEDESVSAQNITILLTATGNLKQNTHVDCLYSRIEEPQWSLCKNFRQCALHEGIWSKDSLRQCI